jgi:hypothetical protein
VVAVEAILPRRKPKPKKTMTHEIATFATRQEAQEVIARLNGQTYYLAHGEYERPDYTARKVRGEDRYYIHARYYYYSGTFNAKQSGALRVEEI